MLCRLPRVHWGGLDRGVMPEVGADEPPVEGPGVLGVAGGVDAEPAAAVTDELLQRPTLCRVEHGAGSEQEGHGADAAQRRVREGVGILSHDDGEPVAATDGAHGGDSSGDAGVVIAGGAREDEDGYWGSRGRVVRTRARGRGKGGEEQSDRPQPDGADRADGDAGGGLAIAIGPRVRMRDLWSDRSVVLEYRHASLLQLQDDTADSNKE